MEIAHIYYDVHMDVLKMQTLYAQWTKTPSSGSSGNSLEFIKMLQNCHFLADFQTFLVIPIFWNVVNPFLAQIENRPKIGNFTAHIIL